MKNVLEEYTGIIGVGCLMSLGLVFITDSQAKYLGTIENMSRMHSWTILMSIPILILNYVFGLIVIYVSELVVPFFFQKDAYKKFTKLFSAIAKTQNEMIQNKYINDHRDIRILFGCSFSLLLVGIGVIMEAFSYHIFFSIGWIGFVGCLVVASICPMIAYRIQRVFIANDFDQAIQE